MKNHITCLLLLLLSVSCKKNQRRIFPYMPEYTEYSINNKCGNYKGNYNKLYFSNNVSKKVKTLDFYKVFIPDFCDGYIACKNDSLFYLKDISNVNNIKYLFSFNDTIKTKRSYTYNEVINTKITKDYYYEPLISDSIMIVYSHEKNIKITNLSSHHYEYYFCKKHGFIGYKKYIAFDTCKYVRNDNINFIKIIS